MPPPKHQVRLLFILYHCWAAEDIDINVLIINPLFYWIIHIILYLSIDFEYKTCHYFEGFGSLMAY